MTGTGSSPTGRWRWIRVVLVSFLGTMELMDAAPVAGPEVIERLKAATAYLEVPGTGRSGTAFCISAEGYFVTCAHVVEGRAVGDKVDITLFTGLRQEKKIAASIARLAPDHDLAILKTDALAIKPLELGQPEDLKETDPIVVAGYPFGRAMDTGEKVAAVTVTLGHVTSIRRDKGKVDLLQMDAELNPGNSGGPVIDTRGRVVGVSAAKLVGTQLNFAVATQWISATLLLPHIQAAEVPVISAAKISEPLEIPFELVFIRPPAVEPKVSAWFETDAGDSKAVETRKISPDHYALRGVPAPDLAALTTNVLRVDFIEDFDNTRYTHTMRITDHAIKVGGVAVKLSGFSTLYPAEGRAVRTDGKELRGAIEGLESLVDPTGSPIPNSYAKCAMVSLRPEASTSISLNCRIEVAVGGYTGTLRLPLKVDAGKATAPAAGGGSIPPFAYAQGAEPSFAGEFVDLKLEAEPDEVAWGGGGRYLVLRLPEKMKLVVMDCLQGRITGEIPLPAKDASFTAGGEDLLVAQGGEISRWTLRDLKSQGPPIKALDGRIIQIAAGSTWTRQIAMLSELPEGTAGVAGRSHLELRDLRSGKIQVIENHLGLDGGSLDVAAASMARVLRVEVNHENWKSYQVIGGQLANYDGTNSRDRWLDAGGRWVMSENGTYAAVNKPDWSQGDADHGPMLPSTVPGLAFRFWKTGERPEDGSGLKPKIDVIDLDAGTCLLHEALTLDELSFPKGRRIYSPTLRRQNVQTCNLVPQLGLFVSMSWESSMVRIRKFDLWTALKAAGQPYLKVTGVVPDVLPAGTPFLCDLGLRASAKLKADVLKAPQGVTVDSSGTLAWATPKAGEGGDVVVRFSSDDGLELIWRQPLWVR